MILELGGDAVATARVVRWDERKLEIGWQRKTERDGRRKVRGDDVGTGPRWWISGA